MEARARAIYMSPPRISHRTSGNTPTRFEKEIAASGGKVETNNDPHALGPWILGDTIGMGSSGRVRLARHHRTGKLAAVKIIPKTLINTSRMSLSNASAKHEKLMLAIRREIVIMKLIDHPNVMSLYDVFEADNELYLLLEFIEGGELFDFLVSRGRMAPLEALGYFRQIIHGVDYCHRFNICHRDLKPENLLLDSHNNIKIADFGMAAMEIANGMLETSCGSPHYASPEIVAGLAYHGAASDIWSCGVVLYALLAGRLPFDDPSMRQLLQKVRAGRFEMPGHIPSGAKDLIWRMLVVNPEQRIQMPDILRHPFFATLYAPFPKEIQLPSLDGMAKPIPSAKHIDPECLQNLMTLWKGTSERRLVETLLSPHITWEKAHYFLLCQYQAKALEEYDMGYSFGFGNGKYAPPGYLVVKQRSTVSQYAGDITSRAGDGDGIEGRSSSNVRKGESSRPRPPAPVGLHPAVRSMHRPRPPSLTPPMEKRQTTSGGPVLNSSRPAPPSPVKRVRPNSMVIGPRPLVNNRSPDLVIVDTSAKSSFSVANRASEYVATTERARMPPPPPPPINTLRLGPCLPVRSYGPAHDTAMKTIENTNAEVVRARFGFGNSGRAEEFEGLQNQHSSKAGEPTAGDGELTPGSRALQHTALPHHQDALATPRNPPRQSPAYGLGFTLAPRQETAGAGPSITSMDPLDPSQIFSHPDATAGNPLPASGSQLFPLDLHRSDPTRQPMPVETKGHSTHKPHSPSVPIESREVEAAPAQKGETFNGGLRRRGSDKENAHISPRGIVILDSSELDAAKWEEVGGSITRGHKPTPLELSTNSYRASAFSPVSPTPPFTPLLSGTDFKGQGWFSNLFNFRPATYVFLSHDTVSSTRKECATLLEKFGVLVALEESGAGLSILKCSVDKTQDSNGATPMKAVKFRVQIQLNTSGPSHSSPSTPSTPVERLPSGEPQESTETFLLPSPQISSPAMTGCVVKLVQEKGARSSLEAIGTRLRQEWQLSKLRSAQPSPVLSGFHLGQDLASSYS